MTLVTLLLTCTLIAPALPGADDAPGTAFSAVPASWRWPLGPPAPRVIRGFSPPPAPWAAGHRGVDLAARPGQPVYAAGPGRVSYTGVLAGRGVVAITHGPLRTTYLPVRSAVPKGRRVAAGTRIGFVQDVPGHCPATCLHWGLLKGRTYLDPLTLVRPRVRLLPLWPSKTVTPPTSDAKPSEASEPRMDLRDATTATGGAIAGMLLALSLSLIWRTARGLLRRKTPPGVIDLAHERRHRRP
ncbi:peptidoglycan DD-metalloendopeptidase family protein [Spirillospora sp. NPDC047279]|uniref:M23 family metallopeptidase n=1 Tax=Spirillospora sp. NPDC047279 TaxID=3155478 RepID=UPI0033DB70C0